MPTTRAQHERSLEDPAVCELLKIRDFLDNVMVRTDGCYVAGFRVAGAMTYFGDDDERNEAKSVLESLLRAMPEQSMRLQFRYEVVESLNGLLDQYRKESRCEKAEVQALDEQRLAVWSEKEKQGTYLTRIAAVYLIWDPAKHKRTLLAGGAPMSKEDRRRAHGGFTLSVTKSVEKSRKEHQDTVAEFESLIAGIESAMKSGGLGPERMSDERSVSRSQAGDAPDGSGPEAAPGASGGDSLHLPARARDNGEHSGSDRELHQHRRPAVELHQL